ncbi:MAG: zf-HC2 domain-containing protein [Candidatus Eisenbacteria bacterium]|nr:zf-HC2 domain-containing protein [Candidatus Eisenbacteria bacterium]
MSERNRPNCQRVRENLGRLLDGELPKKDREELLAHIGVCVECAAEWETVREIRRAAGRGAERGTEEERRAILRAAEPELARLRARRGRGGRTATALRRAAHSPRVRIAAVVAAVIVFAFLVPTRGGRAPAPAAMVVWTYAELDRPEANRSFPLGSYDAGSPFAGERSER